MNVFIGIEWLAKFIVFDLLRLVPESGSARVLEFFIYDAVKILLLLYVMIAIIGFLRSYIDNKKLKTWMHKKNQFLATTVAALFGAVTPFCSCSSIPIFLGMIKAQIPIGAAFAFMVASPLINQYLVVLMLGFFGWKITVFYVLAGLIVGIISGLIIGKLNPEKLIERSYQEVAKIDSKQNRLSFRERINFGLNEGKENILYIWHWVILGVGIGAFIHNYVPQETIQALVGSVGIFSVPAVTVLGVPIYAGCASIVPVAVVLFQKGLPLGTVLAFMMAVSALSLPEAIILKRVMKIKLIIIFFSIVALGIILTGYLLNILSLWLI